MVKGMCMVVTPAYFASKWVGMGRGDKLLYETIRDHFRVRARSGAEGDGLIASLVDGSGAIGLL